MKMIRKRKPDPVKWFLKPVVQATLREAVMSLAIGCMLAGCVAGLLQ
jgi:hypothetical protein